MDWTDKEVSLTVDVYFKMLDYELKHLNYNKSDYRNQLIPYLNDRSPSAVEQKHRNISAILLNQGLPFIKGYKPLHHFQKILEKRVVEYISNHRNDLEKKFKSFSDDMIPKRAIEEVDLAKLFDKKGPTGMKGRDAKQEPSFKPIKINYLEREQNNRLLGQQGEELVIKFEQWRLSKAGKSKLADKIEWVSKNLGDGTGYDILSKNEDGSDRYIEVKTTKLSKETPIYLSKREVSFAMTTEHFYLYRVYGWGSDPHLFIKQGPYNNFCRLEPVSFKAWF